MVAREAQEATRNEAAVGFTVFAGLLMIVAGAFQLIAGVTALVNDEFVAVGREYVLELDATTWGWIHLLLGVVIGVAGLLLYSGAVWARAVGVAVAFMSAITNFAALPRHPIWAVIVIAVDACIIWALTVHGRDVTR